jgi:hypothetical protein
MLPPAIRVHAFRAALSVAALCANPLTAQEKPTMQPALDALVRALQGKQFEGLAPYLDESYRGGGLPGPVARQMLERVVNSGMRVPTAVRVDSTRADGENLRVSTTFDFEDGSRGVELLVTREGKFVEIPLFQVSMVGGAGALGNVRLGAGAPGNAPPAAPEAVTHPELRAELVAMRQRDQQARASLRPGVPASPEERRRMVEADSANVHRLKEIIARHGWPSPAMVGAEASAGAFLVLQHADVATQERHLPLLREAAARGEVPASHLATMEDRVLMRRGHKQRYGTQLHTDPATGRRALWPVEDEAGVDARRAAVGLPPLALYLRNFGIEY